MQSYCVLKNALFWSFHSGSKRWPTVVIKFLLLSLISFLVFSNKWPSRAIHLMYFLINSFKTYWIKWSWNWPRNWNFCNIYSWCFADLAKRFASFSKQQQSHICWQIRSKNMFGFWSIVTKLLASLCFSLASYFDLIANCDVLLSTARLKKASQFHPNHAHETRDNCSSFYIFKLCLLLV